MTPQRELASLVMLSIKFYKYARLHDSFAFLDSHNMSNSDINMTEI